ncbi:frequency clock protein, partial [Massariosphaeria phaeospora]
HPRRPPAHQSVSLRRAAPPCARQATKHSSGGSSDAGNWFDSTNNHALQSNASFVDNDPPFFLRNSSPSSTPPDTLDPRSAVHQQSSMSRRPLFVHRATGGSSSEEYRGVIDDLTVVNKKLKQKLRRYEKLQDPHLQDEKLFEVRFHGLPNHKKRELEEMLQKFAADLDDGPESSYPPISSEPPLGTDKTASSHTFRFAESGYASGQNSVSGPSNPAFSRPSSSLQTSDLRKMSRAQYNRNQENVQSYLYDIPVGLLPRDHAPMTEKSKQELVVRRLEQIFAGKQSAPGSHPQPMQQEEVAQSAAMADRQEKEATGQRFQREGVREARIMPVQAEDEDITGYASESLQTLRPALAITEQDFTGSGSPDQRPTRPMDLDPFRAQVPTENMDYIRHLGFSPPNISFGEAPEDGHGWLYLNLLINLAQLHTFNVTPDFIKDAVTECSSMLELSDDGRKIRWKGGQSVTRNSGDSSSECVTGNSPDDVAVGSSSKSSAKRLKTHHRGSSEFVGDARSQARQTAQALRVYNQDKLTYTPIFFHKDELDNDDDVYDMDMDSSNNSPIQPLRRGNSSGFGSSAMCNSSSKTRREDGPIIFYKAKFCTDLSGDRNYSGFSVTVPTSYKHITAHPLGVPSQPQTRTHVSDLSEPRGPIDTFPTEAEPKDEERLSLSGEDFAFSPEALRNDIGENSPETVDFRVAGLGGVQPDDNFLIKVKRSQQSSTEVTPRQKSRLYPKKILQLLQQRALPKFRGFASSTGPHGIKEEIISTSRTSLPSSVLPTPSFLPFNSKSSGDVDSDLESDVSSRPSTASSSAENGVATTFQFRNLSSTYTGRSDSLLSRDTEDSEGEEDSDDSVDLLATARRLDPKSVRLSEREYDAVLAERLAEDIPAG